MWFPSVLESLDFSSFHSRTRRGRRPPTRKLCLEALEDRTLMSAVHPLFDLAAVTTSPFPTDRFTAADTTQNTGRRVNLPLPDATTHPSDYQDTQVLNTLDGFNMQPRLSIPFDGAIDVNTVNSQDVFLLSMGDTLDSHDHGGQVVGINQLVWDPATNTLHAESNDLLDQHTRYALIVTNGVNDVSGPVEATRAFGRFEHDLGQSHDPVLRFYGAELDDALEAARRVGVRERDIVVASVFRTESATAVLEKIRNQIKANTPDPVDFLLGPDQSRTVFALGDVTGITWLQQTGDNPPAFTNATVDLSLLRSIPGAISQVAFGKYSSPDYEVHPGEYIQPVATRTGTPTVQGVNEIYFNLFLPSGEKPAQGWPVAIYGHGASGSKQRDLNVAATLAEHGIATVIINDVGRGFGPLGTLTVNQTDGESVTFAAGGRGINQDNDHDILATEGENATGPQSIISSRDAQRQTVVDLMQLVRVIQVGMHVNGDSAPDLDSSRIDYVGWSLGANIGTILLAVDPDVHAGALYSPGGPLVDNRRFGLNRGIVSASLDARTPSLINPPGITNLGGIPTPAPYFDENLPLRDGVPLTVQLADGTVAVIQGPVINTVTGAMAIQEWLDTTEWVAQSGNQVAYAPHLRKDPLAGVPAKSILVLFGNGDQTVPNPAATAILRAGGLADFATFYRNDLAYAEDPTGVPKDPHAFVNNITNSDSLVAAIARGAQEQIATFLDSGGTVIIHPEPSRFFETPIVLPLPEGLNYISTAPPLIPIGTRAILLGAVSEGNTRTSGAALSVPLPWAYGQQVGRIANPSDVRAAPADNDVATSGNLILAPAETCKTITVPVQSSKKKEANETFLPNLWEAGNAVLPDPQGIGTILDDNGLGGKH
jgi:dienelactone hydrolase